MGFKDLPYWLKGGIIGLIFILVLYIYLMIGLAGYGRNGFDTQGGDHKDCTKIEIVTYFATSLVVTSFESIIFFGFFIGFLLTGFGIGSLIGWTVGKIKSKK